MTHPTWQSPLRRPHWLKVTVKPKSREVFSYQPMVAPGNREAVPAP